MLKVWKFHVLPRLRQIRQVHLSRQQSGTRCQVCAELPEMSDDTIIINHHVVWRHMKIPYLSIFTVWRIQCLMQDQPFILVYLNFRYFPMCRYLRAMGELENWVQDGHSNLRPPKVSEALVTSLVSEVLVLEFYGFEVSEIGRNRPGRSLLLPQRARRTQTLRGRWSQPGLWYQDTSRDTSSKYSIDLYSILYSEVVHVVHVVQVDPPGQSMWQCVLENEGPGQNGMKVTRGTSSFATEVSKRSSASRTSQLNVLAPWKPEEMRKD